MKILVIVNTYFGYDGISNVATNYYIYQDHSQIQMDLVTINEIPQKLENTIKENGDFHYVMPLRNKNPFNYIFRLSKLIWKKRYDVVHVHGNSNTMCIELLAAKLGQCKTRIAHSHNTKCDHPIINKLLYPIFKFTYTDAFACGIEAGEWLFNKGEANIIANGVDLKRFTLDSQYRKNFKKELNVENRVVIGHVGRFSIQKNHERLIEIFAKLVELDSNVTLLMWGEGELLDHIKNISQKINGDIRFMGTSSEIEKCLHAVDIIVFPSLYEGLPLFLIEAQALGLPCLLSDNVSPNTKITNSVYYKSLTSSNSDWAKEILKITSKSNVEKNALTAHEEIRNAGYDIRLKAKELLNKYQQLIHKNNG